MAQIPSTAEVVIIGGGIIGCSVAYHLASRGVRDVVLLERSALTSGTTWHAAGLVGQLRATHNLTRLAQYTAELLPDLERETAQATGFDQRGSVSVATTAGRFEELRRNASTAQLFGLEAHVLTADEVRELVPIAAVHDVVGGVHLPGDGVTSPVDTTRAFAIGARNRGAHVVENATVTSVEVEDGVVTGVRYDHAGGSGEIRCSVVVNAAGMWARELMEPLGITVPLQAAEHFYIVTDAIDGLPARMPVLRDPDGCSYFKEETGKLLVGWFEPVAKPWAVPLVRGRSEIPESFSFNALPPDLEHIEPLLEAAARRIPALETAGIQLFFNGPESFTPDDRYLLGPSPEVRGVYLACGFNSIGIQSAGGAGRVLADWIVDGFPPMDLWDVDVRRMMPYQSNASYLRERTTETLGLLYAMHWPNRQYETARGVRRSAFHEPLTRAGACFGEVAGWERPNWFARPGQEATYEYSYGRQNWFDNARQEHVTVRTGVGLLDLSSFGKFVVQGPDSCKALNLICANDVDVEVGRVVYTQWLNERGTIEADVTVTREGEDRYLVVTSAASQVRDLTWLRDRLAEGDWRSTVVDVTSAYAVLAVAGPDSRALLSRLSIDDFSKEGFRFGRSRVVDLALARVRASRVSYTGELGWELYIPTEFAAGVLEAVLEAGDEFGLAPVGFHALNSLRMEKAFRHWGDDISIDDSPLEAALGFAVAWDKPGGFIGRDALVHLRGEGVRRMMCQFALTEGDQLLHHNEPILRDGTPVGRITSGAYGFSVDRALGLGYLPLDEPDGHLSAPPEGIEVEVAGVRVPAIASWRPLYDPTGSRLRS